MPLPPRPRTISILWLATALVLVYTLFVAIRPIHAAPAPDPAQQRPDIFPCVGCNITDKDGDGDADMQDLNPVTIKTKQTRMVAFKLVVRPGCTPGSVPADLDRLQVHTQGSVNLLVFRSDELASFTVYVSCGLEHNTKCGGPGVFCLPDGFPYNVNVWISDVISTYFPDSRLSILLHEIVGHAIATWNEQYATCGSSCGFASTPGLVDFMNTGPQSRHGFSESELGRWERTMWPLTNCGGGQSPYWDSCKQWWVFADGLKWKPTSTPWGEWYGPDDKLLWSVCDPAWNGRYSPAVRAWFPAGHRAFPDGVGYWVQAPPC